MYSQARKIANENLHLSTYINFGRFIFAIVAILMLLISHAGAENSKQFVALGSVWKADEISLIKIEKQVLATVTFKIVKGGNRGVTGPEMIAEFCKHFVKLHSNRNIFRIDMNVMGPDSLPIWPVPIPVQVRGDKCDIKPNNSSYVMKYSGPLEKWRFAQGAVQKYNEKYVRLFVFEPDGDVAVKPSDFDFEFACNATTKDTTLQKNQKKYEERLSDIAVEISTVLIVAKETSKTGVFIGEIYKTESGKCKKY